jgi:hypothetical protein
MKKSTYFFSAFLLLSVLFFACKKKKKDEPAPTPTPTPVTPAHVNAMTAKVNGTSWSIASDEYGVACYLMKSGNSRTFGGQSSFSTPYTVIYLDFQCVTGTHTISGVGPYLAHYYSNGTSYYAKTGTINITEIDTSGVKSEWIDKFKCTFSFITDTIGGQSYSVTEGAVDFIKN